MRKGHLKTTMKTKASNRLPACTGAGGNHSHNHICAAFGLLKAHVTLHLAAITLLGGRSSSPVGCGSFGSEMWGNADVASLPATRAPPPPPPPPPLSLNRALVLIYITDGSFSLQDRVNTQPWAAQHPTRAWRGENKPAISREDGCAAGRGLF